MSYLIAYDLKSDNYAEIEAAIKGLGGWCKVQKSVWLTKHPGPAGELRDILGSALQKGDKLLVINCTKGWATQGPYPTDVIKWMKNNI